MGDIARAVRGMIGIGGAVAAVGAPFVPTPVVSVPVGDVIAPAVAVGVVRRILRARAQQIGTRVIPRELTDEEGMTLARVIDAASASLSFAVAAETAAMPSDVRELIHAVETPAETYGAPVVTPDWRLVARLTGEPVVESRSGERAVFGKKRSMELIAWMVLNRDRLTRSGARNAMWDIAVADSTFGTIVSDVRRGLSRIAPAPGDHGWCPATFTDSLVLAEGIVGDHELLRTATALRDRVGLCRWLERVRDVPFAGTSYLWADLDGSTTRIVITVLDAVDTLIELAQADGDMESLLIALRAGLRVMPGDEKFLRLQASIAARNGRC